MQHARGQLAACQLNSSSAQLELKFICYNRRRVDIMAMGIHSENSIGAWHPNRNAYTHAYQHYNKSLSASV